MSNSKYDIKKVYDLYQNGMTINEIARMHGVYNSVIYRALDRHGYKIEKSKKNQPNKKASDEQILEACKRLKMIKLVAEELNVATTTIRTRLKRLGLSIKDFNQ